MSKNKKTAIWIISITFFMFIGSFASFPLYQLFCRVTGYGGTPGKVAEESTILGNRTYKVRFNSDIDPSLSWKFHPVQDQVTVTAGENKLIFFEAENISDKPITGVATYNITPDKAAYFFDKIQCFCFDKQTLEAGEKVQMPVSFFIDPEIEEDKYLDDVKTITLSYTFFESKD